MNTLTEKQVTVLRELTFADVPLWLLSRPRPTDNDAEQLSRKQTNEEADKLIEFGLLSDETKHPSHASYVEHFNEQGVIIRVLKLTQQGFLLFNDNKRQSRVQ